MTTATTKQTAGNNATLARVKAQMNGKIYKSFAQAWNNGGSGAAREYLGQFFNDEAREQVLDDFFANKGI